MMPYYPATLSMLEQAGAEITGALDDLFDRYGHPVRVARVAPRKPWVFVLEDHVVYLGADSPGREAVALELERLAWAADEGIPVPRLAETQEFYFVAERARKDAPRGETYIRAAIAASDRVAAAALPRRFDYRPGHRTSSRLTIPWRSFKMMTALIDPREFIRSRRAAAAIPRDAVGHGDFHKNNIMYDGVAGTVALIDWAYLGYHPRCTDLLFFWTQLDEPADRRMVFEAAVARADDLKALAALHHWLAMRTLVEAATHSARAPWEQRSVARYRAILSEARANADGLGD